MFSDYEKNNNLTYNLHSDGLQWQLILTYGLISVKQTLAHDYILGFPP